MIGVADLTAVTAYAAYWFPDLPKWVAATCLVLNLVTVKLFGEIEFWFALIKIVAIVGLVVVAVVMVASGFISPDGHQANIGNLWSDGGFFPRGSEGFLAGFQIAFFAFLGIELVGTAAAETKNPKVTLPKAINAIPIRVGLFYILALAAIMSVTPWRLINPAVSPFVSMLGLAGLGLAASVINFVVLTSAASSANSGIYSTSRMLYGLALDRKAPRAFGKLSAQKVPANGLLFSCACLLPGLVLLYTTDSILAAFTLATSVASVLFIFVWGLIMASYLVYRKRQPEAHAASSYRMPGGVVMSYAVFGFFAAMIYVLALEPDTRVALAVTPVWFGALAVAYRLQLRRARKAAALEAAEIERVPADL